MLVIGQQRKFYTSADVSLSCGWKYREVLSVIIQENLEQRAL